MTNQEAFDKVYRHLLAQGKQALDTNGDCRYRGPDGTQCAVGCLIPDAEYRGCFEGLCVRSFFKGVGALDGINLNLLLSLQDVHDHCDPCRWPRLLAEVAREYGLIVPVVEAP